MSNYRSIDSNNDAATTGITTTTSTTSNDDRNPELSSSVGAVSNLLSLFHPPPPPPSNQSDRQVQQTATSVANTPVSSGRSRPYNDVATTNEQAPLLQQQQQQQQEKQKKQKQEDQQVYQTNSQEFDGSAEGRSPGLLMDDHVDDNEFDSIMTTPKQHIRHSSSSSSTNISYSNGNSDISQKYSSSKILSIDQQSRIDSIHELLPPIHETASFSDDPVVAVPPAPMTPISSWLYGGNSNNNNSSLNISYNGDQSSDKENGLTMSVSESLSAPSLGHEHKQPLLAMNHYSDNTTASQQQQQQSAVTSITSSWWNKATLQTIISDLTSPSTYIGAFLFLLFELVFSLTIGATITRSSSSSGRSMLGLVTKIATLGTILGGPVYWFNLRDVPALYPVVDLFAAPFLANIATIIDESLYHDPNVSDLDSDEIFLTTFSFLSGLSLFISGCFMILASVFKLANLGSFLPFPVLCGFFTAAACMTWTLAFKVDTNGLTVSHVILSGDTRLIVKSLVHHIPSVLVGATMKYLGPKHPLFVLMSVMITIGLFYTTMFVFNISFHEMIEMHWFWSENDLHYEPLSGEKVRPSIFRFLRKKYMGDSHFVYFFCRVLYQN
jgi:hypothetical protein